MEITYALSGIIVLALMGYLILALVKPEWF